MRLSLRFSLLSLNFVSIKFGDLESSERILESDCIEFRDFFTTVNMPTSFPVSLLFPFPRHSLALGDGKMRDPGNDVLNIFALGSVTAYL